MIRVNFDNFFIDSGYQGTAPSVFMCGAMPPSLLDIAETRKRFDTVLVPG